MLLHSSRCSVSYSSDRVAVRDRVLLNSNANHSLLAWDTRSLTKAFQKTGDIVARPAATKSEVDQSQLSDRGRTYVQDYSSLPANTVKLFQEYAHVPAAELERHIQHIKDEAWKIHPQPCIALSKFIMPTLNELPSYASILQRLKEGGRYLDVGCCMGQDLRQLVMDGVISDNLYGIDLYGDYMTLSYDLFRDKDTLKSHLRQGNILTMTSVGDILRKLKGTVDIIHIGMVMHTLTLKEQRLLVKNCIGLLKPYHKTAVVGTLLGSVNGHVGSGGTCLHSEETLKKLFYEVALEAEVTVECNVWQEAAFHFENIARNSSANRSQRLLFEAYKI